MLKLCSGFDHGSVLAACSEDAYISGNVARGLGKRARVIFCLRYSFIVLLML